MAAETDTTIPCTCAVDFVRIADELYALKRGRAARRGLVRRPRETRALRHLLLGDCACGVANLLLPCRGRWRRAERGYGWGARNARSAEPKQDGGA